MRRHADYRRIALDGLLTSAAAILRVALETGSWRSRSSAQNARARALRQLRDAREKGQQRHIAKRDAVARSGQRLEVERCSIEIEGFVRDVRRALAARVALLRRQGIATCAKKARRRARRGRCTSSVRPRGSRRIAAAMRTRTGRAFLARRRNFAGQRRARARHQRATRTRLAARDLRRADRLAEFHQRLIPVARRACAEATARGDPARLPQARASAAARAGRRERRRVAPARAPRCRRARRAAHRTRCSAPRRPCSARCPAARASRRECAEIRRHAAPQFPAPRDADFARGCNSRARTTASAHRLAARAPAIRPSGIVSRKRS